MVHEQLCVGKLLEKQRNLIHGSQTATCKMSRRTRTENGMCSRHTCKLSLERSSQTPWLSNVNQPACFYHSSCHHGQLCVFGITNLGLENNPRNDCFSQLCKNLFIRAQAVCVCCVTFFLRFNCHTQALYSNASMWRIHGQ